MPGQLLALAATAFVGIGGALVGLWANRKLGLNPAKDSLIGTLQTTVGELRIQVKDLGDRVDHLEQVNRDLRDANDTLLRENSALRRTASRAR